MKQDSNQELEPKEDKKDLIASVIAIIITLLPGYVVCLWWYVLYKTFSAQYSAVLTFIVIAILAYLAFIVVQAIVKQIILILIK